MDAMRNGLAQGVDIRWEEWRRLPGRAKLAFAWDGARSLLAGLARRGVMGQILATALAPVAVFYLAAAVLRDSIVYRAGTGGARPFSGREAYVRHRYGGTQRLVNWREQRVVASLLRRVGTPRRILDSPSGYGRFTPALAALAAGQLVCADIDRCRLAALRGGASRGTGLSTVQANLQGTLPFTSGAFDVVFNLRYLHHVHTREEQRNALAELTRVSGRYVVLSYYSRSSLHALQRKVQKVTRGNRRRGPAMMERREFDRLVREAGCRSVSDKSLLPWVHAQRVVLIERVGATGA